MVEIGGEIKFSGKKPQLNWTFAIIDPSSKISVESNLLSVSVIDEVSAARADAWATALFASKEDWLSIVYKVDIYWQMARNVKIIRLWQQ